MIYQRFSKRQLLAMTWWNRPAFRDRDAIICDGAVRSGKTICMADGFILWSMARFDRQKFAICGKTIESLRRNVVLNLREWMSGVVDIQERRAENKLIVTNGGRSNTYFLFGGRDESSYMLIQGMTLAGVLLDEVALMPRSFVEQALARCSVPGSKFWFNCNPEGPEHWFHKEWLLPEQLKKHNTMHLHFTMADNLALDAEIKQRYERMYSGVFYRRYIQGEWCVAEGLVYQFGESNITDETPETGEYYISVDYGTLNPFSAGLWCVSDGKAVRVREYYYSGRESRALKTDEEYYAELEKLAGDLFIRHVIVDPSAASFIETIRRHGRFSPRKANNDVLSGIRLTATLLQAGRIRIHRSCADAIREFSLYCWDEKGEADKPVKANDHAMDEIRYFAATVLRQRLRSIPELRGLTDD